MNHHYINKATSAELANAETRLNFKSHTALLTDSIKLQALCLPLVGIGTPSLICVLEDLTTFTFL